MKDGPWFVIGDFNEINDHSEKEGGRRRYDSSFLTFKQMISDCGMLEFPCLGNNLSWVGKRNQTTLRCRLDCVLRNANWHEKFAHSLFKYLRLWGSDHRPILASILSKPFKAKKKFKFDKGWLDGEEIRQVIQDGWNSPELSTYANIMAHIASCRKAMSLWRRQNNLN